jgi:hypothetical protein
MNTPHNNGAGPKQDVVTNILPNAQLLPPRDLQAWKLVQRFALTPETARAYADLAFNAGVRS